jgi:uncharacterized protein (TIGR03086 family)
MSTRTDAVAVLGRAVDQAGDLLVVTHTDDLDRRTPCGEWDVRTLAGHLLAAPGTFLQMARGEQPDWSTPPALPSSGWAQQFRSDGDDLMHHWHQQGEDAEVFQVDMQTAELAVHTWDLARALGRPADRLDPEVAERAAALLRQGLTPENRGSAFAAEVPVADDAGPYDRLAGIAGRNPAWAPTAP